MKATNVSQHDLKTNIWFIDNTNLNFQLVEMFLNMYVELCSAKIEQSLATVWISKLFFSTYSNRIEAMGLQFIQGVVKLD